MATRCPACEVDVPDGKFCASCGVGLSARGDRGRLRLSAYAAAPREHVLRPWLTTSLFPRLERASRPAFRAGLVSVAAAAVGFALLGWQLGVIATSVFGLPILFAVYLREIGFRRSMPARYLVLAVVVAVGLGVAWALIATDGAIAGDVLAVTTTRELAFRKFVDSHQPCKIVPLIVAPQDCAIAGR